MCHQLSTVLDMSDVLQGVGEKGKSDVSIDGVAYQNQQ